MTAIKTTINNAFKHRHFFFFSTDKCRCKHVIMFITLLYFRVYHVIVFSCYIMFSCYFLDTYFSICRYYVNENLPRFFQFGFITIPLYPLTYLPFLGTVLVLIMLYFSALSDNQTCSTLGR